MRLFAKRAKETNSTKSKEGGRKKLPGMVVITGIGMAAFAICLTLGIYEYRENRDVISDMVISNSETSEQVEDVTRVMETMKSSADEMEASMISIDSTIDDLQKGIDEIRSSVSDNPKMTEKLSEVEALTEAVKKVKEELLLLEDSASLSELGNVNLADSLGDVSEYAEGLGVSVESIRSEIAAITERMAEIQKGIDKADSNSAKFQSDFDSRLEEARSENKNGIDELSRNINQQITGLEGRVNDNISTYTINLQTDITGIKSELDGKISSLSSEVNSCFQSVSEGKGLIASALTDNGMPMNADACFADMATGVDNLCSERYSSGYDDGYAEGFAGAMDHVHAVYHYHVHSGNENDGGGCYSTAVNVPEKTVNHYCGCTNFSSAGCYYKCSRCGITSGYYDFHDVNIGEHGNCTPSNADILCYTYWVCENGHRITAVEKPSSCQYVLSSEVIPARTYYTLGCGKSEDTIESVTLEFE